ncbi:PhpK family radical SAM P-methyltransferase [Chloroflexi bacterium TSY]|nr:PhpK family radical SAM P-methyltransferase [Chloroflexi bacterium TSY]
MTTHDPIDCVIVGYNDIDFRQVTQNLKKVENLSGAYENLKMNSLIFGGQRVTYMNLLNQILETTTGINPGLHTAKAPSLGVLYLAHFLRKRHFNVDFINYFNGEQERFKELLAQSPNAVAITTTYYVENSPISNIVNFVRQQSPQTKIIVGGPHIYNLCGKAGTRTLDYIFSEIGADIYIYDSQGESTLAQVLDALRQPEEQELSNIPNLIYTLDQKQFHRTDRDLENNDMDENSVDWRRIDSRFFAPTAPLRTARSCSFSCAFCNYPFLAGPLSLKSLDMIEAQLRMFQAAQVKNVTFIDDTFNVPLPRFKNICRLMIKNKFDFNWFSFFRCANADDEAFDLMQESGCKGVFLGIESGDQTILNNMNKFATIEKYKEGIRKLNERGIVTFVGLIAGFPGETSETIQNSMNFIRETKPTFYRVQLYYHDTNAPIHQKAEEFGVQADGYSWQHNTMDWREATRWIRKMYTTIQESSILPVYGFDFWSIPYLLGEGISIP